MHRYATIAGEVDLSTAGQAWVVERLRSHNKQWRGFLWGGGGWIKLRTIDQHIPGTLHLFAH